MQKVELKPGEPLTAEYVAAMCVKNLDLTTPGLIARAREFGRNADPDAVEKNMVVQITPLGMFLLCETVFQRAGDRRDQIWAEVDRLLPDEMTVEHLAARCLKKVTLQNAGLIRRAKKMRKNPALVREHTIVQISLQTLRRICEAVLDGDKEQREQAADPEPTIMRPKESVADPQFEPPAESKSEAPESPPSKKKPKG